MLLKFNSSRASHSVSYHGKRSIRNAKNFQVRIGSSRRTAPSPVHTRIAAVLYACVPVYACLRYEKLDRSNSSRRFPICTVVRLRSRSLCSHWTPSVRPVASRRSLRRDPSRPVECELGFRGLWVFQVRGLWLFKVAPCGFSMLIFVCVLVTDLFMCYLVSSLIDCPCFRRRVQRCRSAVPFCVFFV